MTKDELWKAYCARNPKWEDDEYKMQLSAGMLRKLMESAFDAGFEQHKKVSDAFADMLKGVGVDLNKFRK